MTTTTQMSTTPAISPLLGAVWNAYNAGFHETDRELYREVGAALYEQAIQEQVERLFGRSNEQNARIEAGLRERT